jgi:hypothetical protein
MVSNYNEPSLSSALALELVAALPVSAEICGTWQGRHNPQVGVPDTSIPGNLQHDFTRKCSK